jgi:hypothetical protein
MCARVLYSALLYIIYIHLYCVCVCVCVCVYVRCLHYTIYYAAVVLFLLFASTNAVRISAVIAISEVSLALVGSTRISFRISDMKRPFLLLLFIITSVVYYYIVFFFFFFLPPYFTPEALLQWCTSPKSHHYVRTGDRPYPVISRKTCVVVFFT